MNSNKREVYSALLSPWKNFHFRETIHRHLPSGNTMTKLLLSVYTNTIVTSLLAGSTFAATTNSTDKATVSAEHGDIGLG